MEGANIYDKSAFFQTPTPQITPPPNHLTGFYGGFAILYGIFTGSVCVCVCVSINAMMSPIFFNLPLGEILLVRKQAQMCQIEIAI